MDKLELLNKKRIKEIAEMIVSQWDSSFDFEGHALYINSKDRLFLINRAITELDVSRLRINSLGLYLGEISKNEIRLSIEGAQIIGMTARKNVVVLDDSSAIFWMQGQDIEIDDDRSGFVIIKNGDDILGCGKLSNKKLYNYVPKERRSAN